MGPADGDADFDFLLRTRHIPDGEPPFMVRGQDLLGPDTARDWTRRLLRAGGSLALAELALRRADAMDRWPVKKLPDADHIPAGERAVLEAAFGLRVWSDEPTADRRLREIHEERIRSDGFTAGKRSLRRTLRRMQGQVTTLRDDLVKADRRADAAEARATQAEQQLAALKAAQLETVADV